MGSLRVWKDSVEQNLNDPLETLNVFFFPMKNEVCEVHNASQHLSGQEA